MALNGRKINQDLLPLGSWRCIRVSVTSTLSSLDTLLNAASTGRTLNPSIRAIRLRNLGSVTIYTTEDSGASLPDGGEIRPGETLNITGSISTFDNSLAAPDNVFFGVVSGTCAMSVEEFG